jgi:hypothetical protein
VGGAQNEAHLFEHPIWPAIDLGVGETQHAKPSRLSVPLFLCVAPRNIGFVVDGAVHLDKQSGAELSEVEHAIVDGGLGAEVRVRDLTQ